MPQEKGTVTLSDDDLIPTQAAPDRPDTSALELRKPPDPSWWDRASKGLISPDAFIKWSTGGQYKSVDELEKVRDQGPSLKENPNEAFSRTFHSGFTEDLAKTASSLTSPATLATSAASGVARLPGTAGKIARAMLAAQGIGYGASGAKDIGEGISQGYGTPEGSQKILAGGSQVAAAAPAVAQVGRYARGAAAAIAPKLFAKGEDAFVAALAPSGKKDNVLVGKLRDAYQYHADELRAAPIENLDQLKEYAEFAKSRDIQQLESQMNRIAPQNDQIDRFSASDAIRKRVTRGIQLSNPQEAKAILDYADRVKEDLFNRPMDLKTADQLIIELNKKSTAFDNMSEAQKMQRLANGDPILGEKALKIALQEQIESKLAGYKELRHSYGHWNEIQDQTQNQLDNIARKSGHPDFLQRRAMESLFSAGGLAAGLFTHAGALETVGGGVIGYLLAKFAAEQTMIRLSSPESTLGRGLRPGSGTRPLFFGGQALQPAGSALAGSSAQPQSQSGGDETDKILDQLLGAQNAK